MKIRVKSKSKKTVKPSKKTEKIKDKKPAKKTEKKAVIKGKTKAKKPIKSKKEIKEQKKPVSKKPAVRKAEKVKKTTTRKQATEKAIKKVKKEPKKIALPVRKIARIPQRTIKKIEKSAEVFVPPAEYEIALTVKTGLPGEYGEDRITLMTVDPWKLFAYWEVKENTLSKIKGMFVLRVYDITGIYFDGKNANLIFDAPVYGRIGDSYIGVGPGKVFIVDIGADSSEGDFVTIARSNQASTPALKVAKEEGALPQEIYEVGPVTGYF